MRTAVIDIYHGDRVLGDRPGEKNGLAAARGAGVRGIIHKASQGLPDPLYATRRRLARDAGLLWGAYHYNTSEPARAQVDRFFGAAQPDAETRMCLDFEGTPMSLGLAVEFLELSDAKLGRRLTLYSGNRIKERIVQADAATRAFLAAHPFWLCEYGPHARMTDAAGHPLPWPRYDLWQYAADGIPITHAVPGILVPGLDVSTYDGTDDDLAAGWPGPPLNPGGAP